MGNLKGKVFKMKESPIKGVPKFKESELLYIVPWRVTIDLVEDEKPTNKSIVEFRFHTEKKWAKMSFKECVEKNGGIHARFFIYDGIDKTEEELFEWALNTDQFANDGKTNIYGAIEVE